MTKHPEINTPKEQKKVSRIHSWKALVAAALMTVGGIKGVEAKPTVSADKQNDFSELAVGMETATTPDTLVFTNNHATINSSGDYVLRPEDLDDNDPNFQQVDILLEDIEDETSLSGTNDTINIVWNGGFDFGNRYGNIESGTFPVFIIGGNGEIIYEAFGGHGGQGLNSFSVNGISNPRLITSTDTLKASELPNGEIEITPNQTITIQTSKIFAANKLIFANIGSYPTGNSSNVLSKDVNGYGTITLSGQDIINYVNDSTATCYISGRTHSGGSWIEGVEFNISVIPELQPPEPDTIPPSSVSLELVGNQPFIGIGDTLYFVPSIGGSPGENETIDSALNVTVNGTDFTLLSPTAILPGDTIKVKNIGPGTTTLTVSSVIDPIVSASETLTKNPPSVESAAFFPPATTQLSTGEQVQLSLDPQALQVSPDTEGDRQYVLEHLSFETSDSAVATTTPQGLVTITGTGTVNIHAKYGGETVASLELTGIDDVAPQITLFSVNNPEWLNQDKTYTVEVNEPVHQPQGWTGNPTGTQFTYTVTGNGEVRFSTTDLAGNAVDSTQVETKIDKNLPEILSITHSPTTATIDPVTITVEASDALSGVAGYALDGGAWQLSNEFPVTANGTYSLTVIDSAGNYVMSSYTVSNITTGIEEVKKSDFKLYPNPAKQLLTLETEEPISAIQIMDMTGRVVLNQKRLTNNTVDVSALANGIYVIRIYMPTGYSEKKLIKQ